MRIKRSNQTYFYFNLISFVALLLLVISVKWELIAVKCVYQEAGMSCKTCGLTRAFTAFLNGNFQFSWSHLLELKIILFFCLQFLARGFLIAWLLVQEQGQKLVYIDGLLSGICFLVAFFELFLP